MGVSSFTTADTKESVVLNNYDHPNSDRPVYFLLPGAEIGIEERSYDGYARFGGIDAFEWLAKMNGVGNHRDDGIDLFFDDERYANAEFPLKISYDPNAKYEDLDGRSLSCPYQGLPPHPRLTKALDKGVPHWMAEALSAEFDLNMDDVVDYALLLTKVDKLVLDSEKDHTPVNAIIEAGQGVNIAVSEAGAHALVELSGDLRVGYINEMTFSEIMGSDDTKHHSYEPDAPENEPQINAPPRPKR